MSDTLPQPAVDVAAIGRFARTVYDGLAGFVDVRILAEKGMPDAKPACRSFSVNDGLVEALKRSAGEAAASGRACFAVPATTDAPGRARTATITATAVVLVDLDVGDIEAKRSHLLTYLGAPTLVVASGGVTATGQAKLHLYWRLSRPATGIALTRVTKLRSAIAAKVGADRSLARGAQPIRVPGSVHSKNGNRAPVRIIEENDSALDLSAIERAVATMPTLASTDDAGAEDNPGAGADGGITRYDALSRFIGEQLHQVRSGRIVLGEAWAAVRLEAAMIAPSWSDKRLRREFDALVRVDRRNHGVGASDPNRDRTENGLARWLADVHADAWRYVPGRGWLAWSGSCWEPDRTARILELCRQLSEKAAWGQPEPDRRRLLAERTIRAVERLARSDPRLATGVADWDRDDMLLNTPGGVIDLRTGVVSPNDPGLQMTRITAAAPGRTGGRWLDFVARVTGGDTDMACYLQRVAGYCLTARTDEQAFFFLHGSGANGKTVFLDVLAAILGNYARTAPLDTFMATRGDRQQNDLAGLEGARMVIATETEAGRPWAEARIKAITGGDRIAVRQLYREFFETVPGYKLLIAGNHRPRLSGGGAGMVRRLHLVPFDTVIPEQERDGQLREKLLAERDGILGWMLEGCRAWQDGGLRPPQRVRDAVAGYFDAEDFVVEWIDEDCVRGTNFHATTAELYASWRRRADSLGLDPKSARDLGERLRALGFEPVRTGKARGWKGLRPVAADGEGIAR